MKEHNNNRLLDYISNFFLLNHNINTTVAKT